MTNESTTDVTGAPPVRSSAWLGGTVKFKTIVADPPWDMTRSKGTLYPGATDTPPLKTVALDYPTMSIEEICALPVRELAEDDAHLYLWTTQSFLRRTYEVLDAWGFRQGAMLVWSKPPKGVCGTYVCSVEFCIFARRGSLEAKRRQIGTCYSWPRSHHSAKPEAFLDMVESVSPGPYLEMFARRNRLGWATWGNECLQHVTLVPPNDQALRPLGRSVKMGDIIQMPGSASEEPRSGSQQRVGSRTANKSGASNAENGGGGS